jgi:putative FmdB family regulatory protein
MPLYDYSCAACGGFRVFRPLRESSLPADCPACAAPCQKLVTAPFLADMNPHNRIAHQRNEKSSHEPQIMSHAALERSGVPRAHVHTAVHGHKHVHAPPPGHGHDDHASGTSASPWVRSSRPWMIGH